MKKWMKRIGFLTALAGLVWLGGLIADRQRLTEGLVRLHIVAASDSEEDQARKLLVRDAVLESLGAALKDVTDVDAAKEYLQTHLAQIQKVAQQALRDAGSQETVAVSLEPERFPTREYDTFSLPAGVYDALRVVIGPGQGRNWWCVVYPQLCLGDGAVELEAAAQTGGFSAPLTGAIRGENRYQVRFFLLEVLGKVENFFFGD